MPSVTLIQGDASCMTAQPAVDVMWRSLWNNKCLKQQIQNHTMCSAINSVHIGQCMQQAVTQPVDEFTENLQNLSATEHHFIAKLHLKHTYVNWNTLWHLLTQSSFWWTSSKTIRSFARMLCKNFIRKLHKQFFSHLWFVTIQMHQVHCLIYQHVSWVTTVNTFSYIISLHNYVLSERCPTRSEKVMDQQDNTRTANTGKIFCHKTDFGCQADTMMTTLT